MRKNTACLFLFSSLLSISGMAENRKDSTQVGRNYVIDEVVVTGTRNETDIRHLPMTISIVDRQQIEKRYEPSLLPLLTEQVPGVFTTSRGIMGYGVSTGAAGGMSLRGIGGSPTAGLLVLIDGHPQYMGLMGHPIADAYQSMLAERVEVLRGPASVLYGSNAMGGVINIVTRKQELAMLESIGMSKGQIRKMLLGESLLLVFVAVAVTMTIGTLLGYVLTHLLYNGGAFYISFKFPTVFVLAYTLVLIAVPLLITLVSMHSFSKEALVERLRGMEN